MAVQASLGPRPSLTAFFASVAKSEKSCEGRPGYEAKSRLEGYRSFHSRDMSMLHVFA